MANAIVTLIDHSPEDDQKIVFYVKASYIGNDVSSTGGHIDTIPVVVPNSATPAQALAAIIVAVQNNAIAQQPSFTVPAGHMLVLISGTLQ